MNQAESERLASFLERSGYEAATRAEDADIIVLNSCVVRQSAETKVVNKIRSLRHLKELCRDKIIAVTGCLVNSETDQLKRDFPYVNYFFPAGGSLPLFKADSTSSLPARPSPCVFVPIMQGCNNFCAYCIVPYRRGRERSRPIAEIVCEVKELVRRGAREVTLLGQNVDSYGHDLPEKPDLADLLTELNGIDGLWRIRFLTNHPKDMSRRLIDAIASLDKVCEHLSLPVQAGSNEILRAMRRGYTVEQYREIISLIRAKVPDIALSTDVIVGFPSETKEQFQETVRLLSEVKFDTVHVAAYSPRPGTIAAREMKDNVPQKEKKERLEIIEHLQEKTVAEINARLLNETVEILVEGKVKGKWQGRTRSAKLVFYSDSGDWLGKLVRVKVTNTSPWSLQGELSKE